MLVIACPHALGLAIPLVIALSTAVSARNGILVKDRLALERMRTINAVLFDKTGTLTEGRHVVTGVAGNGIADDEVLRLAGGVELDSEHPARPSDRDRRHASTVNPPEHPSSGRSPAAASKRSSTAAATRSVARSCCANAHSNIPHTIQSDVDAWIGARRRRCCTSCRTTRSSGRSRSRTRSAPKHAQAVVELHDIGIERVVMITGDARQVADAVAAELGIDEVFAEVLPEDKQDKVAELQARGFKVAMVGDGVNDAPALARADVGLAIGAGTDVAIESAGVVLASNDPRSVVGVIRLSKASLPQDGPEPRLGRRLQHRLDPARRRRTGVGGHHARPGGRRHPDERVDHRRGPQRTTAAPSPTPTRRQRRHPASLRPTGTPTGYSGESWPLT